MILFLEQALNGVQFGMMLFLMAAGLTLIFGIMNLINLAHGSLYMVGAYVAASSYAALAFGIRRGGTRRRRRGGASAFVLEIGIFRALYDRDHLDQVLATFGLILFFNEAVRLIWGATALYAQVPPLLAGQVDVLPGRALSGVPPGDHRGRAGGRAVSLRCSSDARGSAC